MSFSFYFPVFSYPLILTLISLSLSYQQPLLVFVVLLCQHHPPLPYLKACTIAGSSSARIEWAIFTSFTTNSTLQSSTSTSCGLCSRKKWRPPRRTRHRSHSLGTLRFSKKVFCCRTSPLLSRPSLLSKIAKKKIKEAGSVVVLNAWIWWCRFFEWFRFFLFCSNMSPFGWHCCCSIYAIFHDLIYGFIILIYAF